MKFLNKNLKKPLLFLKKYKELKDLRNSMTEEEKKLLLCGLEYFKLHLEYPELINLYRNNI